MAITNHERIGEALELLRAGLGLFVEREFERKYPGRGVAEARRVLEEDRPNAKRLRADWDVADLLKLMCNSKAWQSVFCKTLGPVERGLVSELREVRNQWAQPTPSSPFPNDDAERALDSAARLLKAVSALQQADEARKMWMILRGVSVEEQMRSEKPKSAGGGESTLPNGPATPTQEAQLGNAEANVASGQARQTRSAPPQTRPEPPEGVPKPKGTWKLPGPRDKYAQVASHIKQNYKGWTVGPSSKATGGNRLVTDIPAGPCGHASRGLTSR